MMRAIFLLLSISIIWACSQKAYPPVVKDQTQEIIAPDSITVMIAEAKTMVGPCEPSIAIDPNNPKRIVAGSVLDNIYCSEDGGMTWTEDRLSSSFGVYGDPVLEANYKGDFFYAHLSNPDGKAYASESFLDRIVVQRSRDGGKTWNDGSYTQPRSPKDQDKQWMAIDPKDNTIYMTWTEFDLYASKKAEDKSRIVFSKSEDDGESWSTPLMINQYEGDCIDSDNTTEGAVPCVGPDGEIYVSWSWNEKIYFDRSEDRGETWMDEDVVIASQPGGWDLPISGISRANGMPITCVDRSNGPHRGTIYVNWSDQRHGEEDTDIWVAYSEDKGMTWSAPVRVNDDQAGNQQFLTWMDIDQSNGHLHTVFYDRRHQDDTTTDVYLASSADGGRTWTNTQINTQSFKPSPQVFFGDYNDIAVVNGSVRPIWTQLDGWKLSVWTALVER